MRLLLLISASRLAGTHFAFRNRTGWRPARSRARVGLGYNQTERKNGGKPHAELYIHLSTSINGIPDQRQTRVCVCVRERDRISGQVRYSRTKSARFQ